MQAAQQSEKLGKVASRRVACYLYLPPEIWGQVDSSGGFGLEAGRVEERLGHSLWH